MSSIEAGAVYWLRHPHQATWFIGRARETDIGGLWFDVLGTQSPVQAMAVIIGPRVEPPNDTSARR